MQTEISSNVHDFAALVQRLHVEHLRHDALTNILNSPEIMERNHTVRVIPASKYTKVDIGSGGRFMVVNATGEIYGVKGYGVIHRGHYYGTLAEPNVAKITRNSY
jgi:hypothetical protein